MHFHPLGLSSPCGVIPRVPILVKREGASDGDPSGDGEPEGASGGVGTLCGGLPFTEGE
jgi:hypothetical protein